MRFISPQLTPANYHSLIIEPIRFYPEPKPDSQVSMGTLNDIRDYIYKTMVAKVSAKVNVVDKPGPGVARFRGAITAVNAQTEALAAYQYIPIALIVTAATLLLGWPSVRRDCEGKETGDQDKNAHLKNSVARGWEAANPLSKVNFCVGQGFAPAVG